MSLAQIERYHGPLFSPDARLSGGPTASGREALTEGSAGPSDTPKALATREDLWTEFATRGVEVDIHKVIRLRWAVKTYDRYSGIEQQKFPVIEVCPSWLSSDYNYHLEPGGIPSGGADFTILDRSQQREISLPNLLQRNEQGIIGFPDTQGRFVPLNDPNRKRTGEMMGFIIVKSTEGNNVYPVLLQRDFERRVFDKRGDLLPETHARSVAQPAKTATLEAAPDKTPLSPGPAESAQIEETIPITNWQELIDFIRPLPSNLGKENAGNNPRGMHFPGRGTDLWISAPYFDLAIDPDKPDKVPAKLIITVFGVDWNTAVNWRRQVPAVTDIIRSLSPNNQDQIRFVLVRSKDGRIEIREVVAIRKPGDHKIAYGEEKSQLEALRDPCIVSALLREARPIPLSTGSGKNYRGDDRTPEKPKPLSAAEQNRRIAAWRKEMARKGLTRKPKAGAGGYARDIKKIKKEEEKRKNGGHPY